MITHFVNRDLITSLLIILILFALFAWCVRRGMLVDKEVIWIGGAMGFFAASLAFNAVLRADRTIYGAGNVPRLLGMSALMTLPLILAFAYGVFALYRSLRQKELAAISIGRMTLRLVLGNIAALKTDSPMDALICPANTELRMAIGPAAMLKSMGGGEIESDAMKQAPIAIGQAVATAPGKLKTRHVIHAVVMGRDRKTDADKIKKAIASAFKCAKKVGASRVALPDFTGGANALPDKVAPIAVQAAVAAHDDFDEVVIVVSNPRAALPFQREFAQLAAHYPPALRVGEAPPPN